MTQALINSLNIVPKKNIDMTNKMSKTTGMDFGKIFKTKTNKLEKETNNYKPESDKTQESDTLNNDTDICNIVSENKKQPVNETKNTTDNENKATETTDKPEIVDNETNNKCNQLCGIIRKSDKTDSENFPDVSENINITSEEENTIVIISDDVYSNLIIEDDESYDRNINITEEEPVNSDTTIVTDEKSDDTDTTAITEEEPTMYKELITLEDPTALFMLQSQIQKTITTTFQDEQTETTKNDLNNNQSLMNSSETKSNDTSVFKQLETQIVKNENVIKNQPVELPRSKTINHKTTANVLNENIVKELNVEVISSQSADAEGSMGDLMQNQSPQEQTARIMIQGDIKYESVTSETAKNITQQPKTPSVTPGRIIEQISKQLESMVNNSKLNMVLNPGSLGKLNLQIINSKDGILAQFTVTTTEARDILIKGLNGLKESLLAQGVSVDNVSVRLENTESEYESDYTEQEENSKSGYKHQGGKKQKENSKDFEEMMFNIENEGNV